MLVRIFKPLFLRPNFRIKLPFHICPDFFQRLYWGYTSAERRLCNCAEVIWRKQSRNFVQACQQECPSSADYQTWYGASDACNRSGYYRDDLLMAGYRTLFCKCSTGNGLSDRYEYSCAFRNPCYSRKSVIGYFILCDRSSN